MASEAMKREIQAVYALADQGTTLAALMEQILGVLQRYAGEMGSVSHRYRLRASDTGYETAFALISGQFSPLNAQAETDVTVTGQEADLTLVFQRKLSPMAALLRGKIKVSGSKAALMKLAEFL